MHVEKADYCSITIGLLYYDITSFDFDTPDVHVPDNKPKKSKFQLKKTIKNNTI